MQMILKFLAAAGACVATAGSASAQSAMPTVLTEKASPIFGVTVPSGYRQWELIAPSQETDRLDELRAILGNRVALQAYRNGMLPFPDGAELASPTIFVLVVRGIWI